MTVTRRRVSTRRAIALAFVVATLWAGTSFADRAADIRRFNQRPRAALAMQIAEGYVAAGKVGPAANWSERALALPDSDRAHARALRLLEQSKWALRDAGFGAVSVTVSPERAQLRIDDQLFLPARARYRIWLPSGSHQLHVSLAGFSTDERVLSARAGEERTYAVKLADTRPATLEVRVYPVTAEIWIDGAYAGLSTQRTFSVKAGRRLFEARADGYTSYTDALDLEPNGRRVIEAQLERVGAVRRGRPAASNVARDLTPLERANRGERHRLGSRPHDRLRSRDPRPHVSGSADDAKPRGLDDDPGAPPPPSPRGGDAGPEPERPDASDAPDPEHDAPAEDPGAGIDAGVSQDVGGGGDGGGGPASSILKGVIWAGAGAALVGAGVGVAIYGVTAAQTANDLRLGHGSYTDYYDYGATMTYAGYGVAGLGAVATGVGMVYLFGKDGLSRNTKGMLLLGGGVAAAGVGALLMNTAASVATDAGELPLRDPRYDATFDGAEASWRAGIISAGVGGVAALAGAYLLLTRSSGGTVAGDFDLLPTVGPQQRGAAFLLHF
ncbi:MAG: hypothetical protein RIT45_1535 [Pseudomonadota bacterium]